MKCSTPRRLRPPTFLFLRVVCSVRLHVRPHAAHDDREDDAWHLDETPYLHAPCFIVCVEDEANKGRALVAALQSGGGGGGSCGYPPDQSAIRTHASLAQKRKSIVATRARGMVPAM